MRRIILNLSRYPKNDKQESNGNNILEKKLGFDKFVLHIKKEDKTPNYDGTLELLDDDSKPVKIFFVQNKSVEQISKNVYDEVYYDFETNFLNYIQSNVTNDIGIYFVIDISNEQVYYKIINKIKDEDLSFEGKKTVRYYFKANEILSDPELFWEKLYGLKESEKTIYQLYDKETIRDLQERCEYINNLFLIDLAFIKKALFHDIWKFGIKFSQNENHKGFRLVALNKGDNDESIRRIKGNLFDNLGRDELLAVYNFPSSKDDARNFQDKVINKFIIEFFDNHCYLSFLPREALVEKISYYFRFYSEKEIDVKEKYTELFNSKKQIITKSDILLHNLLIELINRGVVKIYINNENANLGTIRLALNKIPAYYEKIIEKSNIRHKYIITNKYKCNFKKFVGIMRSFEWSTTILGLESNELQFEIDSKLEFVYDKYKNFKHYSSTVLFSNMIENNTIIFEILVALFKATIYRVKGEEKDFSDFIK